MTALNKAHTNENGRFCNPEYKVTYQGKEIIMDKWIQEGREGTNIYEVMSKYGYDYAMNTMGIGKLQAITEDVSTIKNLQDLKMIEIKANQNWEQLPLDIRKEFGNSKNEFIKSGEAWLKRKIEELKPKVNLDLTKTEEAIKTTEKEKEDK